MSGGGYVQLPSQHIAHGIHVMVQEMIDFLCLVLGFVGTLTHLAFHFLNDADHLGCRLGTPRTNGQSNVRSTRYRGVRYWVT